MMNRLFHFSNFFTKCFGSELVQFLEPFTLNRKNISRSVAVKTLSPEERFSFFCTLTIKN